MAKMTLAPSRTHDLTNTTDVRLRNFTQGGIHAPFRLRNFTQGGIHVPFRLRNFTQGGAHVPFACTILRKVVHTFRFACTILRKVVHTFRSLTQFYARWYTRSVSLALIKRRLFKHA
jgi:hypothetical protein